MLSERDRQAVAKILEPMEKEVNVLFFRWESPNCMWCNEIEELLKEIQSVNPKFKVSVLGKEEAKEYGVERAPTILFKERPNVMYLGAPVGREIVPFLEDAVAVSKGGPDLPEDIRKGYEAIDIPLEIWVFVTPMCPYCPYMVKYAHHAAMVNDNIKGVMIEAQEYPDLADMYDVSGVPKNIIRDAEGRTLLEWEGAFPDEGIFVHYLEHAVMHAKGVPHEHGH